MMLNRRIAGQINNGFGPIYEQRGSRSKTTCIIILFLFILINFFVERRYEHLSPWYFYEFVFGVSFLVRVLGEVIRRLCLFTEEHRHVESRYDGSCKKALRAVFEFSNEKLILAFTAIALIMVVHSFLGELEWVSFTQHEGYAWFCFNVIFMPALVHVVGLSKPSRVEFIQTSEEQNKNLADGLAWSYYFGYLKFVLPQLVTQINLTERFRHKIQEQHRKVFILLPKNCQVDDTISDPRNLVEDVGNLEPFKKNRGGIRERTYEHTVYRIKDEKSGEEYHCVMEYAAPLKVLSEMSNDPTAGLSREERDYQVVAFYREVKEILDRDPQCKGKYELVTLSGQNDEIGEIMINALKNPAIPVM